MILTSVQSKLILVQSPINKSLLLHSVLRRIKLKGIWAMIQAVDRSRDHSLTAARSDRGVNVFGVTVLSPKLFRPLNKTFSVSLMFLKSTADQFQPSRTNGGHHSPACWKMLLALFWDGKLEWKGGREERWGVEKTKQKLVSMSVKRRENERTYFHKWNQNTFHKLSAWRRISC